MSARLSTRQMELLERVCLRRYTVHFNHYMGSFSPNESVRVADSEGSWDDSFRPATVEALRQRGLVSFRRRGPGFSIVIPTADGLELYRAHRDRALS